MRKAILLFFLSACAFTGTGQPASTKGKDFWVTFSENAVSPQLTLYFSALEPATVTVRNPNTTYIKTLFVPANTMISQQVPLAECYNTGSEVIDNKGLRVTATSDITVYALSYGKYSSDASVILPVQALGTSYRVMTYPGLKLGPYSFESEFCILATQDSTEILVTPDTTTLFGRPAKVPFMVTLNAGQTYNVQCEGGNDLTGSLVEVQNCRPVAVFGASVCSYVPAGCASCDHLYEQLFPVRDWGREFILVPTATRTADHFVVMAGHDNTLIKVNGIPHLLESAGDRYEEEMIYPAYVTGNKPVCVFLYGMGQQCAGDNGDPMMMWITPVEQKMNNIIFASPASSVINSHFVNIVARTSTINSVKINGVSVGSSASVFSYNGDYSYIQKQVSSGTNYITSDSGFTAYSYGYGHAESYGYNVGASVPDLTHYFIMDSTAGGIKDHSNPYNAFEICRNTTISFKGFSRNNKPMFWLWKINNDSMWSRNLVRTFTDTGLVKVTFLTGWNEKSTCPPSDTSYSIAVQYLKIIEPQVNILTPDTVVCKGNTFLVNSECKGCVSLSWSGGPELNCSACPNPSVMSPAVSRMFKLRAENKIGCVSADSFHMHVMDTVHLQVAYDSVVCPGTLAKIQAKVISTDTTQPYMYVLYGDSKFIAKSNSGKFSVHPDSVTVFNMATMNFCAGLNQFSIHVQPTPFADFYTRDTSGCEPYTVRFVNACSTYTTSGFLWDFGDGSGDTVLSPVHTYMQPAVYSVSLRVASKDIGCADTATRKAYIRVYPTPVAALASDPRKVKLTDGKVSFSIQLSNTDFYDFDYGDGTGDKQQSPLRNRFMHLYTDTGYYIVKLKAENNFGCRAEAIDSIFVEDIFSMFIPNAITPGNRDGLNDFFRPVTTFSRRYEMTIFNRWGEVIYTEQCRDRWFNCRGWDGTFNGQLVPEGVYVYMLAIHEESGQHHYENGTLTVLR